MLRTGRQGKSRSDFLSLARKKSGIFPFPREGKSRDFPYVISEGKSRGKPSFSEGRKIYILRI
nr:MAG TPA: hypothetical protein [Caudoviricetes sp.]